MKKLVPFKKDIPFNSMISEVNSISLEHIVNTKSDNIISGKFIVSGDYKMTNSSTVLDKFEYELPFNINVDDKYDINESTVDISDFYYEITNNKSLLVSIELTVDNVKEIIQEEPKQEERTIIQEEPQENIDREEKTEKVILTKTDETNIVKETSVDTIKSVFGSLDENERYVTYKVHLVTENDTIESISQMYNITREQIADYNNLEDIKIGTKIIVPANENK